MQTYWVYIMTNRHNTVIYTGMTSNLIERIAQHRAAENPHSFTARYRITKLVYYDSFPNWDQAHDRELQIKSWSRKKKDDLINSLNPEWFDLAEDLA